MLRHPRPVSVMSYLVSHGAQFSTQAAQPQKCAKKPVPGRHYLQVFHIYHPNSVTTPLGDFDFDHIWTKKCPLWYWWKVYHISFKMAAMQKQQYQQQLLQTIDIWLFILSFRKNMLFLFYFYQMTTYNTIGLRKIRLRALFLFYDDHKGEHESKFHMVRSIIKRDFEIWAGHMLEENEPWIWECDRAAI